MNPIVTEKVTSLLEHTTYYDILGLHPGSNKKGEVVFPEADTVRTVWYEKLREAHPEVKRSAPDDVDYDFVEAEFRAIMEAGLCLLGPAAEAYQDALKSNLHSLWMKSNARRAFTDPLPDWLVVVAQDLVRWGAFDRGAYDLTAEAMFAQDTSALPAYVPGERLRSVDGLDLSVRLEALLAEERFFKLRQVLEGTGGITWTWRSAHWSSQGSVAVGKARKLSPQDRAHRGMGEGDQPVAELHIAFDYWIVADEVERERLLFHELCHFSGLGGELRVVAHEVEAFASEIARYGVQSEEQAQLVAAALSHPTTPERMEQYGVMPDDQLVLFRGYFQEARKLA